MAHLTCLSSLDVNPAQGISRVGSQSGLNHPQSGLLPFQVDYSFVLSTAVNTSHELARVV